MRLLCRAVLLLMIGGGLSSGGCAYVPPLHEDGIAISEIVERVKCELAIAMPKPEGEYPTGPYQWMRDWTAKVDLTLITNDQSAVTPSTSFIYPMHPETLPLIGTFARSFTFGVGAGLTNNAIRNEDVSFTLSMKELQNKKYNPECSPSAAPGLYGNLGLKEWIDAALTPVDKDMLTIGFHTAPGAKPTAGGAKSTAADPIQNLQADAGNAQDYASKAKKSAQNAKSAAAKYRVDSQVAAPSVSRRDIQNSFDQAGIALGQANTASRLAKDADADFQGLTDTQKNDPKVKAYKNQADQAAKSATSATAEANAAWKSLPKDPPLDSIAHQVQFIVLATANASPSWTLVHFKGPAASNTLASVNETQTDTLNIAMGEPAGTINAGPEQIRQLNNLHLDSLQFQTFSTTPSGF